jgi:uncharacterized protein involved in copper resistance
MKTEDRSHRFFFTCALLLSSACASHQPSEAASPSAARTAPSGAAKSARTLPSSEAYQACKGKEPGQSCVTILEDQATEGQCVNPPPGGTEPGLVCRSPQALSQPPHAGDPPPMGGERLHAGRLQPARVQ